MNEICKKLLDILKSELSEITSSSIVDSKCKAVSKNHDTITSEDINKIKSQIIASVLLYGGEGKARSVKDKLDGL